MAVESNRIPAHATDSILPVHDGPSADELVAAVPGAAFIVDGHGAIVAVNEEAAAIFGDARFLIEQTPHAIEAEADLLDWASAAGPGESFAIRTHGHRDNGVPVTLDLHARRSELADRGSVICSIHELCDTKLTGEAQRHFDVAFDNSPIGMAIFNTDGEYVRVNDALCEMLGRSREFLIGRRDQELTHPDDRQSDVDGAWRVLRGELDRWQCEKRFVKPDGSVIWVIANLTFLRDSNGNPLSWVGQFQDITERHGREAEFRELSERDPLTAVYNRRKLESELAARLEHKRVGALLILDLDGFKEINDRYGHRTGDRVLVGIATTLQSSLRDDDIVARIGGDEFAILLDGVTEADARNVAALAVEVVRSRRFRFDPETAVSASVGIACFDPRRRRTAESLMAEADRAMYRVKGRSRESALAERRRERRRPH